MWLLIAKYYQKKSITCAHYVLHVQMKISNFLKTHFFSIVLTFVDDFTLNMASITTCWEFQPQFCCDASLTVLKSDLHDFHKLFFSCFLNLQQTVMKNLTLIIAMSLGLFVLGTFATSDPPKAMYKRLPLSFKDNGELRCPGSKIKGPRKDLLTKNLLNRFGITVATRFQVICS